MPYSPYQPDSSNTSQFKPGTTNLVTHSFSERLLEAEFDDALVDQAPWKNPRYDGSKLTGKKINEFNPVVFQGIGTAEISVDFTVGGYQKDGWLGDKTGPLGATPIINNETTALYIANTVIGGTEDPQFATLQNHSYVGINKILLIDPTDDSVQIIDKTVEPFNEFHTFITNDFPTGVKTNLKIIDESISSNLKLVHRVKMNKGYLLKSFKFQEAGEFSGSAVHGFNGTTPNPDICLTENNSMYLYKSGSFLDNFIETGSFLSGGDLKVQDNRLRFRYGVVEMIEATAGAAVGGVDPGHKFDLKRVGPLFTSSSIFENKFTKQYYTGSFGFIKHQVGGVFSETFSRMFASSGLGSASKFLGIDTLDFLSTNNANTQLTEQEKTEVHFTFFEGTKDFAPGKHDERSIGTFEADQNKAQLGIEQGDSCNNDLPTNHEITFKGPDDKRFLPTIPFFEDTIQNAHLQSTASSGIDGCAPTGSSINFSNNTAIMLGTTIDKVVNANVYVQGGALGTVGFIGVNSGSIVFTNPVTLAVSFLNNENYGLPITGSMSADNYYSGSFNYEVSFLDKDHTLILDLDKNSELFDGIGDKGLLLIPDNTLPKVKNNIEFYLNKAGIIENTSDTQQNVT